jgi:hypothetical protein
MGRLDATSETDLISDKRAYPRWDMQRARRELWETELQFNLHHRSL